MKQRWLGIPPALLLLILSALVLVLALGIGTTSIDVLAIFHPTEIIWRVRFPRVALAALAGAGLSVAGATLQALLQNPLADPYVVGVSGGAALGGVAALVLGFTHPFAVPVFAFAGALAATLLVLSLAGQRAYADPVVLLLVGVVFNAFASALVTFLKTIVTATKAQEILFWLMGVISVEENSTLLVLGIYVGMAILALWLAAGVLDLLALGNDEATALGLPVERARAWVFGAAALLVGGIVAVCGMIGFVGLVVPHVFRRLIGARHALLIPACALGGAVFLVIADALARLTFFAFAAEIPVGVITAFVGGPFFLSMLLKKVA